MRIRVTKWECRRLIDILTCGVVGKDHQAWANNLAQNLERELQKQIERDEGNERRT